MHIRNAEYGSTFDTQYCMCNGKSWRPNRLLLRIRRIEDTIGDQDWNRILNDFILMHLDRTKDGMLDNQPCPNIIELETRLSRPRRFAITINTPARNESAVPNNNVRKTNDGPSLSRLLARGSHNVNSASCNEQSIHRKPTAVGHRDRQCIREVGLPVQQSNGWAHTISCTELQGLVLFKRDIDGFDIDARISQFDNSIDCVVLLPLLNGFTNAMESLAASDTIEAGLDFFPFDCPRRWIIDTAHILATTHVI